MKPIISRQLSPAAYTSFAGPSPRSNNVGGYTQRLFLAPLDYFTTVQRPLALEDSSATTADQYVEIAIDHVMATGKTVKTFYGTRDKGTGKKEAVGERDGRGFKGSCKWFIPGVDLVLAGMMVMGKNDRWIIFEELADGTIMQGGSSRFPAELKATFDVASNESGLRGMELEFSFFESTLQFYTGVITTS